MNTIDYLPKFTRDKELYKEMSILLDALLEVNYRPHIYSMRDQYDPKGEYFDPEAFLELINGLSYKNYLFNNVEIEKVAYMLPRIYQLKGTKTGMRMLLNVLGVNAKIYIWWELIRSYEKDPNQTLWNEFTENFTGFTIEKVQNCGIYLHYEDKPVGGSASDAELEDKLRELLNTFMWVCAEVSAINFVLRFYSTVTTRSKLVAFLKEIWLDDKFDVSAWRDIPEDKYAEEGFGPMPDGTPTPFGSKLNTTDVGYGLADGFYPGIAHTQLNRHDQPAKYGMPYPDVNKTLLSGDYHYDAKILFDGTHAYSDDPDEFKEDNYRYYNYWQVDPSVKRRLYKDFLIWTPEVAFSETVLLSSTLTNTTQSDSIVLTTVNPKFEDKHSLEMFLGFQSSFRQSNGRYDATYKHNESTTYGRGGYQGISDYLFHIQGMSLKDKVEIESLLDMDPDLGSDVFLSTGVDSVEFIETEETETITQPYLTHLRYARAVKHDGTKVYGIPDNREVFDPPIEPNPPIATKNVAALNDYLIILQ